MGRQRAYHARRINETIVEQDGRIALMLNVGIAYFKMDGDTVVQKDHIHIRHRRQRWNLETFRLWLQDGV